MRYRHIYTSLILLVLAGTSSAQDPKPWSLVLSPSCPLNCNPRDLAAFDSTTVYLYVIKRDSLTYSEYSNCYRTLDGGSNWDKIDFGSYNYFDRFHYLGDAPHQLYATDRNEIYVFGSWQPPLDSIPEYQYKNVLYSSTKGATWNISPLGQWNAVWQFPLEASGVVLRIDPSTKQLLKSFDRGKSFISLGKDSVFNNQLYQPSWNGDSVLIDALSFAQHSIYDFTIAIRSSARNADTFSYTTAGLNTLITHESGSKWTYHNYRLPGDSTARIYVDLQPIRNTPHLYAFNAPGREGSEIISQWPDLVTFKGGYHPNYSVGISFLYSSNQGETWIPNYSFGKRFRAYEAVAFGEIWMTVCPEEEITNETPAWWIVHTTDNGVTWDIDSVSLKNPNPEFPADYDGQIIEFSDPNHGWIASEREGKVSIFRYDPQVSGFVDNGPGDIPRPVFSYYPHPVTRETTLLIPETLTIESLQFYDIVGRDVFLPYTVQNKGYEAKIWTENLSAGLYLSIVSYTDPRGRKWKYSVPLIVSR
jgi:hypothetical protein